jgi:hypothetical protein
MRLGETSPAGSPPLDDMPSFPIWIFLFARLILSGLGVALFAIGRVPTTAEAVTRPYFGVTPVTQGLAGMLLGVWQRFDAIHYLRIAAAGYSAADLSAYYPLYPWLVRLVATFLGKNYLLSSLLVSNAAACLAVVVFYKLVVEELGDVRVAQRAIIYLVFFPTAFFLLAPYTESLALLLSLVAFREARHGRWLAAGGAGLACALVRPQGALIVLVVIVEAARRYWPGVRPPASLAVALGAPVLGLAGFIAWRAAQGFPPLSTVMFNYWQRITTFPLLVVPVTIQRILGRYAAPLEYFELAVVVIMLALGVLVLRRLSLSFGVYYWGVLLFNLSSLRLPQPISSQARYALALFPAFIVLGQLGASPRLNRLILFPFFAVWMFLAGQFIMWGWVG